MAASPGGQQTLPDLAALGALVQEAGAVRPPRSLLFEHGEYLLAIEHVHLTARQVAAARQDGGEVGDASTPRRAAEAALRERVAAVAALGRPPVEAGREPPLPAGRAASPLPGAGPSAWPALDLPDRPSPGLVATAQAGVELAVLDVRRPFYPSQGGPAASAPTDAALEYVLVRVRLVNGAERALPYFPLADFTLRLPDTGTLSPVALSAAERYETGELAPGDSLIANVAYLVPRAAAPLVLRFAPAAGPALEVALP